MLTSLITAILVIAVVGFCAWLILKIPMPAPLPQVITALICLAVVLWLLGWFGLYNFDAAHHGFH